MSWYDTGTVAVTNGSTTVTGTGTNFLVGAQIGEGFYGPDERLYEIASITSATVLVLADGYLGSTQSGQDYKIVPTQSLVADLATQVSSLITDFADVRDEAGAGKFDDGVEATPGITFLQDQDTGFYRPTANELAIVTAASERVRVDDAGNVGVGISTPNSKFQVAAGATDRISLDVSGVVSTLALGNVNTGAGNFIASYDRTTGILTASIGPKGSENGAFRVFSNGDVRFDADVGIGTSSPAANLEISSDANTKIRISDSTSVNQRFEISHNAGFTAMTAGNNAVNGVLAFYQYDGTDVTEAMRIGPTGNIGIGTNVPGRKLSILDNTTTPLISVVGSTTSVPGVLFGDTDSDAIGQIRYNNSSNSMTFVTSNTTHITLLANGSTGIGTPSPAEKLHVNGDARIGDASPDANLYLFKRFDGVGSLNFQRNTAGLPVDASVSCDANENLVFDWNQDLTTASCIFNNGASEAMRIDSTGALTVGNSDQIAFNENADTGTTILGNGAITTFRDASTANIYVGKVGALDGDVLEFRRNGLAVGSISVASGATTYNTSSDVRLKENITDAPEGNVDALQVRSFNWKADGTHQEYGFIAQELEAVAPYAVTKGETEDDMWGVDYSKLVPMLVKEIQDLKARIATLEAN